jgi:ECF sigma factor
MAQPIVRTQVTGFLKAWSSGRPEALERLMPVVHDELRRLAASSMRRERRNHTLQVTGLVNEAYPRLIEQQNVTWLSPATVKRDWESARIWLTCELAKP